MKTPEVPVAIVILKASALYLLSRQETVSIRKCLIALSEIMHFVVLGGLGEVKLFSPVIVLISQVLFPVKREYLKKKVPFL